MAFKFYILSTLLAVASAGYSPLTIDAYSNQQYQQPMYSNQYTLPMAKTYSNHEMDNTHMQDSGAMYRNYMSMPQRMDNSYSQYHKFAMNPRMMMPMPNNYNVRYTSAFAPMRPMTEHYSQMNSNDYHMGPSYNQIQMPEYQTGVSALAGYKQSAMKASAPAMPDGYHSSGYGSNHMMMPMSTSMMSRGSNSATMPSSAYVSFNGNGASYQW